MRFKPGGTRIFAELDKELIFNPSVADLGATDGVQYSSVSTFGTTAVQVLNEVLNPGYSMKLRTLEFGLAQRFTGLNGSFVGSIIYHWQAQSDNYVTPDGTMLSTALVPLCGTIQKAVGTLLAVDDVFSGRVPIGSLPYAPVRIILTAVGAQANLVAGKVSNSSYVRMIGSPIPGA